MRESARNRYSYLRTGMEYYILNKTLDKNRNKVKTTLYSKMLFQKSNSAVTVNHFIQLFRFSGRAL